MTSTQTTTLQTWQWPSPPLSPEEDLSQLDDLALDPDFQNFKASAAVLVRASSGRRRSSSNPHMRRAVTAQGQERSNDPAYLERRERNNAAAKRSRDLRSSRLDDLLVEEAYLERCVPRLMARLEELHREVNARAARGVSMSLWTPYLEQEEQELPLDLSTTGPRENLSTPVYLEERPWHFPSAPQHPVPLVAPVPVYPSVPVQLVPLVPSRSVSPEWSSTSRSPVVLESSLYDEEYLRYRQRVLAARPDAVCTSNPRMRRDVRRTANTKEDPEYIVRRAKNNEAAKRSRDQRKIREVEAHIRVSYLKYKRSSLLQQIREKQRQLTYMT